MYGVLVLQSYCLWPQVLVLGPIEHSGRAGARARSKHVLGSATKELRRDAESENTASAVLLRLNL